MENKYDLTLEQNVFLAKRNLVDNIYANARMEGINITFSETKMILDGKCNRKYYKNFAN